MSHVDHDLTTFQQRAIAALRASDAVALDAVIADMEAANTPMAAALASYTKGIAAFAKGAYPTAMSNYEMAIDAYAALGDRHGVARTQILYGNVLTIVGDFPAALQMYRTALDVFEETDDQRAISNVLTGLGHIANSTGNWAEALSMFTRALAISEELRDATNSAGTRLNISSALLYLGQTDEAHAHLLEALSAFEAVGDAARATAAKVNVVTTYIMRGELDEARSIHASVDLAVIADPEVMATYLFATARLFEADHRADEAADALHRALELTIAHGLRAHELRALEALRDNARQRDDLHEYVTYNERFVSMQRTVQHTESTRTLAVLNKQRELDDMRRDRERERTVLYSTLPRAIADRIVRGETINDHIDDVVVLFLDLVGFTRFSSEIPAADVVRHLAQVFTVCEDICTSHGMTPIKTIGDAYMAVAFPHEGYLEGAVKAARELRDRVPSTTVDERTLSCRIGMHIGPVIAGIIGKERMQYDVWGDTVNVAARLESHAEPGTVHISDVLAVRLLPHDSIARGTVEMKGKGAMHTYLLT